MSYSDRQRLEEIIKRISQIIKGLNDSELQSHLVRHLCVLASSYIEATCRDIIQRYIATRADFTVQHYVNNQLSRFQNPNSDKMLDLLSWFNQSKRKEIEGQIDASWRDAVNSLIGNKNNIAHGRDSQISFTSFSQYFERAQKFITRYEEIFLK